VPLDGRLATNRTKKKEGIHMTTVKNTVVSAAGQLIAGTKKHFASATSLAFGGGTHTLAELEASLQTLADLRTAVDDARTATQTKVAAEATQAPPLRSLMAAYVAFVKATFGSTPDALADFGLKPRKPRTPLTLEQKALAAAKGKATRAARHTMGPVQKKEVTGTITTIVSSTPATAPQPVVTTPGTTTPAAAPATGTAPHTT
jgi:hypothetical protein